MDRTPRARRGGVEIDLVDQNARPPGAGDRADGGQLPVTGEDAARVMQIGEDDKTGCVW